jgi:hypothetical protein
MGNINPNIKPGGLTQKDLVDYLYMVVYSMDGLCAKLDADASVTDEDYQAVIDALFNCVIEDSLGNYINLAGAGSSSLEECVMIAPTGIGSQDLIRLLFQIYNAMETLTEKLDADGGVTDTTHEALCYTACFLHMVENEKGTILGNGNTFYFRPGGQTQETDLVNALYEIANGWETLCEQLDAGGGVSDTNYEALWFTATYLLLIEDSKGNTIGVTR